MPAPPPPTIDQLLTSSIELQLRLDAAQKLADIPEAAAEIERLQRELDLTKAQIVNARAS